MIHCGYNRGARGTGRGGQALVLVVLLMMAVILLGILFVAMVTFNQGSSTMMSDRMKADQLAKAGLKYADYMLTYSPDGMDWRPPFVPYTSGSGPDPVPPVFIGDPSQPYTSWTATNGMWGPDATPYTDDDYYMEEEVQHGWSGLVSNIAVTGGPSAPYYARMGFTRYPDPNNAGHMNAGALDQLDINQGHFLLRITYAPSPPFTGAQVAAVGDNPSALQPDLHSRYLKIESIGVVNGSSFVWRDMVAYKPLGLTDHILWVTDKTQIGKPAQFGYPPWIDLDNNNTLNVNSDQTDVFKLGDFLPVHFEGPMRFDPGVEFRGDNADGPPKQGQPKNEAWGSIQVDLVTGPTGYDNGNSWRPTGGGYDRADLFEANGITEDSRGTDANNGSIPAQSASVNLITDGNTTSHTIWATNDPSAPPYAAFDTYGGYVLGNLRSDTQTQSGTMDTLKAPDLMAVDPNTHQAPRYYQLTRDSGPVIKNPTTKETANIGRYGHGKGVYVDDAGDIQFFASDGSHDLQALQDDWLGNLSNNDPRIGDSGWNATHTMYVPRGVEITLYDTESEALEGGALSAVTALTPPVLTPSQVWWPGHVAGEPGIRLTRHDHRWMVADPTNPGTLDDDSGTNVMYVDYPPAGNQVIFAEGNIRIHGILPPDPSASGRYNLTVVSGGTIYVDGQILSPQDVAGRATGTNGVADAVPDEQNSYVALLALDCVTVNPTQIVPALTQGMVTSAPDNATAPLTSAQHWELRPGLGGSVYSNWMFGAPPTSDGLPLGSGNQADPINLVPYHTGQDPGPAGMALSLYNPKDDAWGWYDFDPTTGSPVLNGFLFAPPGAFASGGGPNISNALSPQWAPSALSTPPVAPNTWPLGGAGLKPPPAPLSEYLSPNPGDTNGLAFEYLDPGLINVLSNNNLTHLGGAGGTDYWLKKFKIEELDPVLSTTSMLIPKAAVHAKINALMYAENGCFFVIPPPLFDPNATGDATNSGLPNPADRFRRLNYDIEIRGAITEDFHASPAAWGMWQDQAAYPQYFKDPSSNNTLLAWGTIDYIYDETMLASRVEPPTQLTGTNIRYGTEAPSAPGTNLPKFPLLPACPGLIYQGSG